MLCIYFISLTACTYLIIIAFCTPTSHHMSGDDKHDTNENVVDNEDQEDHQEDMPRVTNIVPPAAAAAAAAKKPTAGAKMSGETKADYPPSSFCTVSRIYGLGTEDKYTITEVSKGNADFYIIGFIVDGVLPEEGGYQCNLSKDGFTLSRSRRELDFGGSHREYERHSIRTRVSSENDETVGGGSRDY